MPPKTTPTIITTLGSASDTSIANADLQVVIIGRLQEIVNQLTRNGQVLKNKINKIEMLKIKMLLVKIFIGEKLKLKRFLT